MLGVEPVPGAVGTAGLVAARWERGAVGGWRVVGVALPETEVGAAQAELLEGLVAGDVVIGVGSADEDGNGPGVGGVRRVLVHRGDRWTPVR